MWTRLFRASTYIQRIGIDHYQLFNSGFLTPHELFEIGLKVSKLSFIDLRREIGKEIHFKNFFVNISMKIHLMKTDEIVTLMVNFVKNPDFRDFKHTMNMWPALCMTLINRIESLSVENIIDVFHSLCFVRAKYTLVNELLNLIIKRFGNLIAEDFMKYPLNKYSNILWALSNKKVMDLQLYKALIDGFIGHKDFEHLSYDLVALNYSLFVSNVNVPEVRLLAKPIEDFLMDKLENMKGMSFAEYIDILYYILDSKSELSSAQEITGKILEKMPEHIHMSTLRRIIGLKLPAEPIFVEAITQRIKKNLDLFNIIDLIFLYLNPHFADPDLKKLIISKLYETEITKSSISFQKLEQIITEIIANKNDKNNEIWLVLEHYINCIIEEPMASDHLLLRIILWIDFRKIECPSTEQRLLKRILEKDKLPSYHSKDTSNLIAMTAVRKFFQQPVMIDLIDHKIFTLPFNADYYDTAKSLYYCCRINRLGYETSLLQMRRLLDKEILNVTSSGFSMACYTAVMLNNLEFAKKNLTFAKAVLNFSEMKQIDLKISEYLSQKPNGVSQSVTTVIRVAWMLTYLKIQDLRLFNTNFYEKLEKIEYSREDLNRIINSSAHHLDSNLCYILMQILAINAPDRPETLEYLRKINEAMEKSESFDEFRKIDEETHEFYKDVEQIAQECFYETTQQSKLIFGNYFPLAIEGKQVILYTKEHYQYQSEGYESQKNPEDLLGIHKMRTRMLEALGVKYIEFQKGDWEGKTLSEKKALLAFVTEND